MLAFEGVEASIFFRGGVSGAVVLVEGDNKMESIEKGSFSGLPTLEYLSTEDSFKGNVFVGVVDFCFDHSFAQMLSSFFLDGGTVAAILVVLDFLKNE